MMLLFFRNDTGLGGNNGLTDFKQLYGYPLALPATKRALYMASVVALLGGYLLCRAIVTSKAGRVLARRARRREPRDVPRLRPAQLQALCVTFSAVLCGVAGALYVPQVGIINPSELQPSTRSRWRSGRRSAGAGR